VILRLIRARYRLQWAQVRRNAWRTAFFVAVQLFTVAVVSVASVSGLAGAAAAVQAGRVEGAAQVMLGAVFLNAIIGSAVLGFGTLQIFSDAMLRRYPLSRARRLLARNVIGLCEPMWIIAVAAFVACAAGFWLVGAAPFWRAMPAVLLLVAASYLVTRLVLTLIERAAASATGQFIIFFLGNLFLLGPMLSRSLGVSPAVGDAVWQAVRGTPPFAAAALVAGTAVVRPAAVLTGWIVATAAVIMWLEAHPPRRSAGSRIVSAGPGLIDRAAAVVSSHPPLVAKTIRYYLRHRGVRMNCIFTIVIATNFAISGFGQRSESVPLPVLLGVATFVGGMGTSIIDTNLFGFEGSGFRRLLLTPVAPRAALRAISGATLLLGACLSVAVIGVWSFVVEAFADPRVVVLALFATASGLFFFHGLGVWTSVLAPKPVEWNAWFKNQQSGVSQFVTLAGMLGFVALFFAARGWAASGVLVRYWWAAAIVPLLCGVFYAQCLERGGRLLDARRERVLSMLERGA
jgi:hypothetical protein